MRILCFIDSLGSGGAQRQMITLAKLLHEQGHDVSFLVYHHSDFFKDKLEELSIDVNSIIEKNIVKRILKIRKFIRNGGYDTVISFLETPNFINNISAIGGKNWTVITSERSSKLETFSSIKGKIFGFFQSYSDYIVCNSHNAKNMWIKYYPEFSNKLQVIYNPVILPTITSHYIPKVDNKLHITIAASYQYLKNPLGLLKALIELNNDELARVKINWYGRREVVKGDSRAYLECKEIIEKNNLHNSIVLNKETKDILNIMNESDVVALFSTVEGLPNAICEGMMLGKPIIMSKVSDYGNLIDSNGVLCDAYDVESIKSSLIKMVNMPLSELLVLGNNSKIKSIELFSKDVILQQWLDLIEINNL